MVEFRDRLLAVVNQELQQLLDTGGNTGDVISQLAYMTGWVLGNSVHGHPKRVDKLLVGIEQLIYETAINSARGDD